MISGNIALN